MTRIRCLDCKNTFEVDEGLELFVHCPVCDSQDLRWIIGSFNDSKSIREVVVKRLIR